MATVTMNLDNVGDIYTISVNNPGQEFGNFQFNIAPGPADGLPTSAVENAVQAFVDSILESDPNFVLSSIVKTTHTSSAL